MIIKTFKLADLSSEFKDSEATLTMYSLNDLPENLNITRPAMVVVPGGGYSWVSLREAEPVALRYVSEGFTSFVLKYTCKKVYPACHKELAFVLSYINTHAEEFNILSRSTSVVGFSAGGHLVSSYGYTYPELAKMLNLNELDCRPFTVNAGYPVISLKKYTHLETCHNITGDDKELIGKLSVNENIKEDYPPTFVWTTEHDNCVPYQNSVLFEEALGRAKVKHQFYLFSKGDHGRSIISRCVLSKLALPNYDDEGTSWVSKDVDFIYRLLDKEFNTF